MKKILYVILFIIVVFLSIVIIKRIVVIEKQYSIEKRMDRLRGKEYEIIGKIRRVTSENSKIGNLCGTKNNYKLIYEMSFDCSVCLVKLKSIYDLYLKLLKLHKIGFFIVSIESSDSYIKYFLNKELETYDICIINQKDLFDGTDLYLLDKSNKIIIAGDVWDYPFLRKEYLKRFK